MQNSEQQSSTDKHLKSQEQIDTIKAREIMDVITELDESLTEGLREFQDAVNYGIFFIALGDDESKDEDTIYQLKKLRILFNTLGEIKSILARS